MIKFNKDFNVRIISLLVAVLFLFNSTVYGIDISQNTPSKLRIPVGVSDTYKRITDAINTVEEQEELDKIIKRLKAGDEKALGDLFDLSKRIISDTIFTIAKVDNVFNEAGFEKGVHDGHIIPLTDLIKADGVKIAEGIPELLNILIDLGIIDPRFKEEKGLCLVPMREANPLGFGASPLHARSVYSDKVDTKQGVMIWKGNGGSRLNQGLSFNIEVRGKRNIVYGGITTGELNADVNAAQKLQDALEEVRKSDSSIPDDLFFISTASFLPLYIYLQGNSENLSEEGLKIVKEEEGSPLAGAFLPVARVIPFLQKFGGLSETKQRLWEKAIKDMRFFAYTAPAPWRTAELWSNLDFFQKKLETNDRKEIFYNFVYRYALIAAIIHKKMDMITSNKAILEGHRLSSTFSPTNMGYAAFDYATLISLEEFIEELMGLLPEEERKVRKAEVEAMAINKFEMIRKAELDILKNDTIGYVAHSILEKYSEEDLVEALRYFDSIYASFGSLSPSIESLKQVMPAAVTRTGI